MLHRCNNVNITKCTNTDQAMYVGIRMKNDRQNPQPRLRLMTYSAYLIAKYETKSDCNQPVNLFGRLGDVKLSFQPNNASHIT